MIKGPDRGEQVQLSDEPITFGSAPNCDLVLSDKTVSRRHAMAVLEGEEVIVRDLGSTNGTFIQGSRFKEITVSFGAEIKVGRTVIKFVPEEEAVTNGHCLTCARLVEEGKGFRTPPDPYGYRSYFCEAYLRVRIDGAVTVKDCSLRDFHDGPHRARDGAEWDVGVDDYVPSPHEAGSRITKAS